MAIYPCDQGNHRYPQPQQSVYRTTLNGREPVTVTARLCPRHFRDVVDVAAAHLAYVDDDTQGSLLCDQCGERRDTTVFLRAFPAKEDERMYCADLCERHAGEVVAALSGPSWRPMRER